MTFEEWFQEQYFYTNMRYKYGDGLFLKDGDMYRLLVVQMVYMAWKFEHAEINQLKKNKIEIFTKIESLITDWRGLKIKGIAPEHRAFEDALKKCADQLEKVFTVKPDET